MTNEEFQRWADNAGLTAAQIGDATNFTAGSVANFRCGATSITGNFELALLKAYPHDAELWQLIGFKLPGDCPHCYDGLVGDDPEYNEPEYCPHCRQGLRLELTRIEGHIDGLQHAINATRHAANALNDYRPYLTENLYQYQELHTYTKHKLAELEA